MKKEKRFHVGLYDVVNVNMYIEIATDKILFVAIFVDYVAKFFS